MMGYGIGTTHYYVNRDPRRQDLLREAAKWELARGAGAQPAWSTGRVLAWGRRELAVLRSRIAGLAFAVRPTEPQAPPGPVA